MLRNLRAGSGLSTGQAAERLGFSRSKISRLENGQRGARPVDIIRLCELYRVDEKQRLRLTDLAAEGKQRAWWQPLSLPYSDYVGLEAEAAAISDYGLAIVPGLLQTEDYARAILRSGVPVLVPEIVEERVQARMARQQRLCSPAAPRFEAVLDESVLHRVVESPAVMRDQLRQLLEMSELPNVGIQVVPYDAGAVPAGVNKFVILWSSVPSIPDIVLVEDLTGHRLLGNPREVETYRATFRLLADLSNPADPGASRAKIVASIRAYETQLR